MKWIALALVLLASPAAAQSWMVGTWFGHGQPHEKSAMYIDRMRADGSWRGEYRTCVKGKCEDQIQTGRWSVKGDMLVLQVEKVGNIMMPRTDNYRMQAHSPVAQKYVSLDWNYTYTPQRVADDFRMPSCELTS
jgi:homogentisate 1,2-dioxygenase